MKWFGRRASSNSGGRPVRCWGAGFPVEGEPAKVHALSPASHTTAEVHRTRRPIWRRRRPDLARTTTPDLSATRPVPLPPLRGLNRVRPQTCPVTGDPCSRFRTAVDGGRVGTICPSTWGDRVKRRVGRVTRTGGVASMGNPTSVVGGGTRLVSDYAAGRWNSEIQHFAGTRAGGRRNRLSEVCG